MIGDEVDLIYEYVDQRILPEWLGGDLPEESWLYGTALQAKK